MYRNGFIICMKKFVSLNFIYSYIFIIFLSFFLCNKIDKLPIYVTLLPSLLIFVVRKIAWTAHCWARFRFPNHPLILRASWRFTRRACGIRRTPRMPTFRRSNLWQSTILRDCTSISSVASTLWEASVDNSSSPTVATATIRLRRVDTPAITTRWGIFCRKIWRTRGLSGSSIHFNPLSVLFHFENVHLCA